MNLHRFMALFIARNMEFFRDRAALSWAIIMPVLLILGFTFAFSGGERDIFKVGILGEPSATESAFIALPHIQFVPQDNQADAAIKVERHQLDLLLQPQTQHYWVNDQSARGTLVEQLLQGSDATTHSWQRNVVSGSAARYIDWVIPGILSMNMMFSALYGVGYVIVRYRKNGVLKRLSATPLTATEFLVSQLASRLWIILVMGALVYIGLDLLLDFRMFGNYFLLFSIFTLGAICMITLGLIITSRLATEEVANGILNLVSWPMMFLSGVWFSLEGAPHWMQLLSNVFPLSHVTTAARAVMLEGAGIAQIWPHMLTLGIMSIIFLAIGAWLFRWQR